MLKEQIGDSRHIDIYNVLKREDYSRSFQREQKYFQTLKRGESRKIQEKLSSDTRYAKINLAQDSSRSRAGSRVGQSRATSLAVSPVHISSNLGKPVLKRSSSEPFLHSWDFNNIDESHKIVLPGGKNLYECLTMIWATKRARQSRVRDHKRSSAHSLEKLITEIFDGVAKTSLVPNQNNSITALINSCLSSDSADISTAKIVERMNQPFEPEDPKYLTNEDGDTIIVAGSKKKLIEVLIAPSPAEPTYVETLIITYYRWISSEDLFSTLISMFRSAEYMKDSGMRQYCRSRVIEVLSQWITFNNHDFHQDTKLFKAFFNFLSVMSKAGPLEQNWSTVLQNRLLEIGEKYHSVINHVPQKKKRRKSEPSSLQFISLDPIEIARQMSLFDWKMAQKVTPFEFMNFEREEGTGINVLALKQRSELVSSWVASEIIMTPNEKHRIVVLSNFLSLCLKLTEYRNYNGLLNVYLGLKKKQVSSLRRTWNGLSSKLKRYWEELEKTLTVNGFTDFFEKTRTVDGPKVLPSFIYLRYLALQEQSEPDYLDENKTMINFAKLRVLGHLIMAVKQSQGEPFYHFAEDPVIQEYLRDWLRPQTEENLTKLAFINESGEVRTSKKKNLRILRTLRKDHTVKAPKIIPLKPEPEILAEIHEELCNKWKRPIEKSSVAQDLHRLMKNIELFDFMGWGFTFKSQKSKSKSIKNLTLKFSKLLNETNTTRAIDSKFLDYFPENNSHDLSKCCHKYLTELLGENSKVTTLLKVTCSQGILSPAWVRLKLFILQDFPFKDVKSGWKIYVIFEDDKVIVAHRKKERSTEQSLSGHSIFQFTWELQMIFDLSLTTLQQSNLTLSSLNIIDRDAITPQKQEELKNIFQKWRGTSSKKRLKKPRNGKSIRSKPKVISKKEKRRTYHSLKGEKDFETVVKDSSQSNPSFF
eukprot:TRINITY_DN7848_c0_g1_i1.p1 TRINITY_DN7848_c0_g1~~TRINITY_DN7848_c0_g1_i1.p1  ORF type:complete len:928 (+),score=179.16 TRINITY_DN7848_c0_g1_i1:62-2845(+)